MAIRPRRPAIDLALHYLNRMNIAVVKILSKFDLRRLCRVVGATPLARLGAPTPEEAGKADVFETVEIGGDRVTVIRQEENEKTIGDIFQDANCRTWNFRCRAKIDHFGDQQRYASPV